MSAAAELVPVVRSVTIAEREWECLKDQARMFVSSGVLSKSITKPEQAMVIMMRGRELNVPPMTALSMIHFFDGNTVLAADLMKALCLRDCKGARIETIKLDDKEAIVEMERPGDKKPFQYRYTIEMAKRAGLTGKNNWVKHPEAMLLHRATAIGCRDRFPDVILGCYIPDEADEMKNVTPADQTQRSAEAMAARALETDYLPGVEPKQTADQFCARLKDVPMGYAAVRAQLRAYEVAKDVESFNKLKEAALKSNIQIVVAEEDAVAAKVDAEMGMT